MAAKKPLLIEANGSCKEEGTEIGMALAMDGSLNFEGTHRKVRHHQKDWDIINVVERI